VREVIEEGTVKSHGATIKANAGDPLLRIKVTGKALEVVRHASSVKKISK